MQGIKNYLRLYLVIDGMDENAAFLSVNALYI